MRFTIVLTTMTSVSFASRMPVMSSSASAYVRELQMVKEFPVSAPSMGIQYANMEDLCCAD